MVDSARQVVGDAFVAGAESERNDRGLWARRTRRRPPLSKVRQRCQVFLVLFAHGVVAHG